MSRQVLSINTSAARPDILAPMTATENSNPFPVLEAGATLQIKSCLRLRREQNQLLNPKAEPGSTSGIFGGQNETC